MGCCSSKEKSYNINGDDKNSDIIFTNIMDCDKPRNGDVKVTQPKTLDSSAVRPGMNVNTGDDINGNSEIMKQNVDAEDVTTEAVTSDQGTTDHGTTDQGTTDRGTTDQGTKKLNSEDVTTEAVTTEQETKKGSSEGDLHSQKMEGVNETQSVENSEMDKDNSGEPELDSTGPKMELPPPKPPQKSRKDIIPDVNKAFSKIDTVADQVPESEQETVEGLAKYLTSDGRPTVKEQTLSEETIET